MKTKLRLLIAVVFVATMVAFASTSIAATPIKWKMQSTWPIGAAGYRTAEGWTDAMNKMTNGMLEIKLFPPNAIVPTAQMLQSLKLGVFEAAMTYGGFYGGMIPETDLEIGLPLSHQTWDEVWDVMYQRGLGDLIQQAYGEQGLRWYPTAADYPYHFLTNFPVRSLDDLKGKKIRAVGVFGKYVQAVGASATSVMPAEMYMALRLGTVDGALYGATGLQDSKLHEVVKYYTLPSAAQISISLVISQKAIDKLPKEIREVVQVGSRYVMSDLSNQYISQCKAGVAKSERMGSIEASVLPEEELAKMRKLVVPIWDELAAKSPRMKKGVDILKQQMRDLGRPME